MNQPPNSQQNFSLGDLMQIRIGLQQFTNPSPAILTSILKLDEIISSMCAGFQPVVQAPTQTHPLIHLNQ